jgi:uncharacterized protein (DUF488 family)
MVLTVGHSTLAIEDFLDMLRAHAVALVVDVRTVPRSRHNPQFNRDTLPASLAAAGIDYRHLPRLGGLRHSLRDSQNTFWRNASFRGFADYMQTEEFEEGLAQVLALARTKQIAIMCAEAVPWRCHRSLIADALLARGTHVEHILSPTRCQTHALNPGACVTGARVAYPGKAPSEPREARPEDNDSDPAHGFRSGA